MAVSPTTAMLLVEAAKLGGQAVGKRVGTKQFRKQQKEIESDPSGMAQKLERQRAGKRGISEDYGMSDAEKRREAGRIGEAAAEEGRQAYSLMMTEAAKGGLRSGKSIEMLSPVFRALMEARAQAGGAAAVASEQKAAAQKAQDAATAAEGALAKREEMQRRAEIQRKFAKMGGDLAGALAQRRIGKRTDIAGAAGAERAAAAGGQKA